MVINIALAKLLSMSNQVKPDICSHCVKMIIEEHFVAIASKFSCLFFGAVEAELDDQGEGGDGGVSADRYSKARLERASVLLEDYTELISDLIAEHGEARITDIARAMGIAHPTATKAVARLKREGLATSRPYRGVFLTDAGEAMAEKARIRHGIVLDLLLALGVPQEAAELDAEGIEHHVSDETLSAFDRFVKMNK